MASTTPSWLPQIPEILLARFPFMNAISLAMLLAERAEHESYPPMLPKVIYVHIGVFIICGFMMSGKFKRKEVALVYAGQMIYMSYNMYSNNSFKYTQWQRIRMASRHLGCAGMFLIYSYIYDAQRSKHLRKIGESVIGIFLVAYVYTLNNSSEDKRGFLSHIPGDEWSRYFFTLVLACGAMCFFAGYFLRDISFSCMVTLAILTVFIDCDIKYWVNSKGMHYWNQLRVISDDLCLILGFAMIGCRFDNKVKMD